MKRPRTIELPAHLIPSIQAQMQLIRTKELELSMLREGLEMFISKAGNVNLAAEHWTLDTDHWTLSKES